LKEKVVHNRWLHYVTKEMLKAAVFSVDPVYNENDGG